MYDLPPPYHSVKELGVYDQLPANVKEKLVGLTDLPESVKAKGMEAMAAEVAKPETQTKLMKEVVALADSVVQVDDAFQRVKDGLGKVDQNDYKDKSGKPIGKFQPAWIGYQERWTDLLWSSRDVATKTEAYIKDFVNVIIPEIEAIKTEEDLADVKRDLAAFIKRKDPFGKQLNSEETKDAAMKHSREFTDLRRDLETFQDTFDGFAADQNIKLSTDVLAKKGEIAVLKLQIDKCRTIITILGLALGLTVFVTITGTVAALAATGPIAPFVALGIVIVGAIAAITELGLLIAEIVEMNGEFLFSSLELFCNTKLYEDLQQKHDEAVVELNALVKQQEHLKELKAILIAQKADITDICGRLDRFAAIWGIVKHDATLINTDLDAAVGDDSSKKAFKTRVALIKDSYTHLGDALALYAIKVSSSSSSSSKPSGISKK